jgi:hypothetical protein
MKLGLVELVRDRDQSHRMGHTENGLSAADKMLEGIRISPECLLHTLVSRRKVIRRMGSAEVLGVDELNAVRFCELGVLNERAMEMPNLVTEHVTHHRRILNLTEPRINCERNVELPADAHRCFHASSIGRRDDGIEFEDRPRGGAKKSSSSLPREVRETLREADRVRAS